MSVSRPLTVLVLVALVAALSTLTATTTAIASANVVLGAKAFAPDGTGWGTSEPAEIFNGGDPSGLITEVHWSSWGDAQANGSGKNPIFKPQGGYYRRPVSIELRASGLGRCAGRAAYTRLSVREPRRPGGPLGPWRSWSGATSICVAP
jgi:hypothetical protein